MKSPFLIITVSTLVVLFLAFSYTSLLPMVQSWTGQDWLLAITVVCLAIAVMCMKIIQQTQKLKHRKSNF